MYVYLIQSNSKTTIEMNEIAEKNLIKPNHSKTSIIRRLKWSRKIQIIMTKKKTNIIFLRA